MPEQYTRSNWLVVGDRERREFGGGEKEERNRIGTTFRTVEHYLWHWSWSDDRGLRLRRSSLRIVRDRI